MTAAAADDDSRLCDSSPRLLLCDSESVPSQSGPQCRNFVGNRRGNRENLSGRKISSKFRVK